MAGVAFWTIATIMATLACAFLIVPLYWFQRAPQAGHGRVRVIAAASLAVGLPLAALGIYWLLGSPALIGTPTGTPTAAAPHAGIPAMGGPAPAGQPAGQQAGDMAAAISRLEARLAANPDDREGWRLLAQSYKFMGDDARAAMAAARADGTGTATPPPLPPPSPAAAGQSPAFMALEDEAQSARRARDFPKAVAAFERLAKLEGMNADLWADYADAVGAARGSLAAAGVMIDRALTLDPRHPKALWLKGSLQTEQRDFGGALATWETLLAVLPPGSPDARLVTDNRDEARAALGPGARVASAAPAATSIVLRGDVRLADSLKGKAGQNATVFVFAKVVGQPGPPLAVLRTTAARWPLSFTLDDSNSMTPDRRLSDEHKVVVEARVSLSGQATPQRGDLRGTSPVVDPAKAGPLHIVIAEEIG